MRNITVSYSGRQRHKAVVAIELRTCTTISCFPLPTDEESPMLTVPGHERYDHINIYSRKDYSWPNGKRLAFYIACNVEHFAFGTGLGPDPAHRPGQNTRNYAWRDYGIRIGQWRLF